MFPSLRIEHDVMVDTVHADLLFATKRSFMKFFERSQILKDKVNLGGLIFYSEFDKLKK